MPKLSSGYLCNSQQRDVKTFIPKLVRAKTDPTQSARGWINLERAQQNTKNPPELKAAQHPLILLLVKVW